MGLKQQPKCKEQTCRFCQSGKYCTILKQKPKECRFYKEKEKGLCGEKYISPER